MYLSRHLHILSSPPSSFGYGAGGYNLIPKHSDLKLASSQQQVSKANACGFTIFCESPATFARRLSSLSSVNLVSSAMSWKLKDINISCMVHFLSSKILRMDPRRRSRRCLAVLVRGWVFVMS